MSSFDILGPDSFRRPMEIKPPTREIGPKIEGGDQNTGDFAGKLADALGEVTNLSGEVKDKAEALARGENVELHDIMVSMGKSDVAFNLMLELRNKLLEAWNTISRSAI